MWVFGGEGSASGRQREGRRGGGLGAGTRGRVRRVRRARRGRRCRARGGRKPGAERPSGAPPGAETRAGRGGRVRPWVGWASGLSPAGGGTRHSHPRAPRGARAGGARGAAEVWESKTEFPVRKSVLARSGICWGRLAFLPLSGDPTPRRRRLENFFWRLATSQTSGGLGGPGGGPGGGRGARRGSRGSRGGRREEGGLRWGGGSGPNGDLREG